MGESLGQFREAVRARAVREPLGVTLKSTLETGVEDDALGLAAGFGDLAQAGKTRGSAGNSSTLRRQGAAATDLRVPSP